jgi:hypothetical protein
MTMEWERSEEEKRKEGDTKDMREGSGECEEGKKPNKKQENQKLIYHHHRKQKQRRK